MNSTAQIRPLEKMLVLVGAGNAHLQFIKRWSMKPMPGVAVTLVNEFSELPYSAMVPGFIMGEYSWDDISIDLVKLCSAVKVRFVRDKVTAIDRQARKVRFAKRAALGYDALALGVGSIPAIPEELAADVASLSMRPIPSLLQKLDALEVRIRGTSGPFQLVVVGGGASGCELALAIQKRLAHHPGLRVTLLQANERLLPNFAAKAARILHGVFQERGIGVRLGARVTGGGNGELRLENGGRLPYDAVIWATHAAASELLRSTGLSVDAAGFVQVNEKLQSLTDPAVFATGDCVSLVPYPTLPKNGVHAVREGVVLFDNLLAFLRDQPLLPFVPQRVTLSLLNSGDGQALFTYGPVVWKGRWARKLKERIDRAWMEKFQRLMPMMAPAAAEEESYTMRCGGCGSKVSSDVLSAVLKRIDVPDDPRIVFGSRAGEDAAVHRMQPALFSEQPEKLLEVQTVDYFKAFIDDPYLFGRIAALHSVSDLHAMNARPFSALAIATLPYARGPVQESLLFELLSGAVDTFRELGVVLSGGHTTEGPELALGFSVTGYGEEGRLFQKGKLQSGDRLILTKPVGSGAILAAWMRGVCQAEWFDHLLDGMLQSNAGATGVLARNGVSACTDITGFGLAGHMLEMLDASRLSARINLNSVPVYDGFREVARSGILSTLQRDNAKVACRVVGAEPEWLFDPQTSGGLLAAVRPEQVDTVLAQLWENYKQAAVIGEVVPVEQGSVPTLYV